MFQAKASKERLVVVKSRMACKSKPRASICAFVLEMKGYFDRLESLNMVFDTDISINIILSDLLADYNQFVLSYQMNKKETSIMKLHSLLQTAEQGIKKSDMPSTSAAHVLTVGHNAKKRKTSHSNWKGKDTQGKSDRGSKRKVEFEIAPTSDPKEAVLKESRRLKHGELNLVTGNRKITPVTRIGKYELMLKSRDGYQFSFNNKNGDILVYSNGFFMFKASPCKGIYETIKCISNNGNVILNVGSSNKLDKSKLWHSRLRHVNKKRIAQLQKDGVLKSFDFKSDDVCESFLLGKMTKSPFTGTCERGEGLLDLVHTDVCGPFRSATKDGKRYYVTFTDDFSRYGYVYLIKHKSDTFEVFKRLLVAGISASMRKSHSLDFLEAKIRNDIPTLQSVKDRLGKCFTMYLRNTKDGFLVYGGEKELKVAGWSQSGWVFLLTGGVVTWKSSKQDTVADSTCESEYIAACEASKEAIWMKNFIGDLGVVPTVQDPIEIFCDNESAVALTKEPKDHGKSKHIERKYHFVRSKVEEGHVIVKDIRSEDNPADLFTKALAKYKHDEHAKSIGLKDKIEF
ncbi:retrotransposon protein, putative, ty1-copia subclass [Tanacetum coccineum]